MAETEHKIEVELSLKDDMSPILRAVEDALRSVNDLLAKTGNSEGGALGKIAHSTRELGEEAKRAGGFLGNVDGFLAGIGRTLGGPAGMAGMAVAAAGSALKQIDKFVVASREMKNFSRDTGFSVEQIKTLQLQWARAGEGPEKANAEIVKFGRIFDELAKNGTTSDFFREIYAYNKSFAMEFNRLAQAGERWQAMKLFRDEYFRAVAAGQTRYAEQLLRMASTTKTAMTVLNDSMEGAVKMWQAPQAAAEQAEKNMNTYMKLRGQFLDASKNILTDIKERALFSTIIDPEEKRKAFEALHEQEMKNWGFSIAPFAQPLDKDLLDKKEDSKNTAQDISDILQRMLLFPLPQNPPQARQEGGAVLEDQPYRVGEDGAELFAAGGGYRLVGEGGEETFRPPKTGIISKIDAAAREYQPPSVFGTMLGRAMGGKGIPGMAAQFLKGHAGAGDELKSQARKLFGIDDPGEPAPWASGGEWGKAPSGVASLASREAGTPPWMTDGGQNQFGAAREAGTPPWMTDGGQNQFGAGGSEELTSQAEYMKVHAKRLNEELDNPAVQNWTAMNQQLKLLANEGRWGQAEGQAGGSSGTNLFGRPIIEDLRKEGGRMEERQLGIIEDVGTAMDRERGTFSPFAGRRGQPISLRGSNEDSDALNRRLQQEDVRGQYRLNGEMIYDNVPPGVTVDTNFKGFDQSTKRVNKQRPELAM